MRAQRGGCSLASFVTGVHPSLLAMYTLPLRASVGVVTCSVVGRKGEVPQASKKSSLCVVVWIWIAAT